MSAGRAAPWRSKPSQELQALVAQLAQPSSSGSSLYVLQRPGPSSFVVGQDPGGDKFKVALGNQPTCSCRHSAAQPHEPCVHLLFIMLRVMRLAADNPLLWQSALTDRELQELLDGRLSSSSRGSAGRAAGRRTSSSSSSSSSSSGKQGSTVQRRTIEQDEPCPICYESLSGVEPGWLVWCSSSCGKSIHGRCMRVWSDHQTKTLQQELSCPLCRCPWGRLDWSPPAAAPAAAAAGGKAAAQARSCHKGVSCSNCQQNPIEGSRYRCLECAAFNLF
ncbi:hypothetical protein OEZ86_003838 [Tetradesmus obliquus]|nr:hypothetical protein OEZ86_003838 [Tetradesmus obliquus]